MTSRPSPTKDIRVLRALVVDDEPPARRRLSRLLERTGQVHVVSQARSVSAIDGSIDFEHDLDVVFLDINMPGESGVDYAQRIIGGTPVVFVTAYPEHAVEAFGVSAVDYLLKPVKQERLEMSLLRVRTRIALQRETSPRDQVQLATSDGSLSYDDGPLGLSVRGGLRLIEYSQVVSILAQDDYTEVVLADGSSELVAVTMKTWEQSLPAELFLRVHRSAIISKQRLQRLERSGSRWLAWIEGHSEAIPVSRSIAAKIRADLKQRLRVLG